MKINQLQIEIDDLKLKGASPVGLRYASFSLPYHS
jgi:hypothetical protein